MKKVLAFSLSFIILILCCGGCGAKATAVPFNDLVAEPEQYNGKTVTVEGIYLRGWEWIILTESVAFLGTGGSKELRPVGQSIWFAGLMPNEVQEGLYRYVSPAGDATYYGKVKVTGVFECDGNYGNMKAYKYRITAEEIELLEWTPPQ